MAIDIEESSAKAILEKLRHASDRIFKSSRSDLARFRKTFAEAISELQGYRNEWDTAYNVSEAKYHERLAELGAKNLAQVAIEQQNVEQELTRIETRVEPEIVRIESEIGSLEGRRATLLKELRDARSALARSRLDFAQSLNSKLGNNVVVDLSGSDTTLYFSAIDKPLQGSGMQYRENQILQACESFSPEQFVQVIRTSAIDQLTKIGITDGNASRMINNLGVDVLYEIERIDVPQSPSIRIKREGEAHYTDLSALSIGEKCSAILSIALLSKGKPLVIDQPEDDLDHAFIINSIVEGIRTAKPDRQILAATHNPNIPVLGDAEMVFRVARQAGKDVCHIQNSGGLELPKVTVEVQNLEGGAEAFERRRQRYSGVPESK